MKRFLIVFMFVFCITFAGCGKNINQISESLDTYTITAKFDETSKILTAEQTINYTNNTDVVIEKLPLHLYPNAFSEGAKYKPVSLAQTDNAYPNGLDYGKIDISSVAVNGKKKDVVIDGIDNNILSVDVGKLYPDDKVDIAINYSVLLANCKHRLGYGDDTFNFGNFYPIVCVYDNGEFMQKPYSANGDPFFSKIANYDISLTINKDFVLATTGKVDKKTEIEEFATYKIKADAVRDFAFVISKKFEVISKKVDDTVVSYYYFEDKNYNQSLKASVDALSTFEELFGDYPYATLSVVESDFLHGGMEYPTLVYISNDVKDYGEYTNVIVHEIAHQWWYGLVGNNEYDDAWLDEGLAEMSCLMFYDQNPQYNVSSSKKKELLMANYVMFVDVFRAVYGKVDESMTRPLDEYISETEYTYITYVKGNIMFADLQDFVGKKKFQKALKRYFNKNKFGIAGEDDLIAAFCETCGKGVESFIKSYLNGKVKLATK